MDELDKLQAVGLQSTLQLYSKIKNRNGLRELAYQCQIDIVRLEQFKHWVESRKKDQ